MEFVFPGALFCFVCAISLATVWAAENKQPESRLLPIGSACAHSVAAATLYIQAGPVVDPARDIVFVTVLEIVINGLMVTGVVKELWPQVVLWMQLLGLRGAALAAAYALFASTDSHAFWPGEPSPNAWIPPALFGLAVVLAAFLTPESQAFRSKSMVLSLAAICFGALTYYAYAIWAPGPFVLFLIDTALVLSVVFGVLPQELITAFHVARFGLRGAIAVACLGEFFSSVSVPTGVSHLFWELSPVFASAIFLVALLAAHYMLFRFSSEGSGKFVHGLAAAGVVAVAALLIYPFFSTN